MTCFCFFLGCLLAWLFTFSSSIVFQAGCGGRRRLVGWVCLFKGAAFIGGLPGHVGERTCLVGFIRKRLVGFLNEKVCLYTELEVWLQF